MISVSQIEAAVETTCAFARRTPVMTSPTITSLCDADIAFPAEGKVLLKAENLQKAGSFKIRGAYFRLSRMSDAERARGVVCASSGNHGQAVALAGRRLGIPVTVFMSEAANIAKIRATKGYGAEVVLEGRTYDEALIAAKAFVRRRQSIFVSSYDDDDIIAGCGTLGFEILNDIPDLDTLVVAVGGGGMLSGVAHAVKTRKPDVKIVGVQAEGADTAVRSFQENRLLKRPEPVNTICDAIAVKAPSERTFEYIQTYADEMVTVSDSAVATALLLLIERMKLVVEPSGAAALAALLSHKTQLRGKTGVLLCGGNTDLKLLSDLIDRELLKQQRYVRIFSAVEDRPGSLAKFLDTLANQRCNAISVEHDRTSPTVPLGSTGVEILFEVRDPEHKRQVIYALRMQGYSVKVLD